jgi:hypothetical protein
LGSTASSSLCLPSNCKEFVPYVCVINNNRIHPYEAHFLLTMIAGANILQAYLCTQDGFDIVMGFLERHLNDHYGQRIRYIGFKQLVLNSFSFLSRVSNICLNIYSAFLKLLMYCSRLISFSAFTCSFFIRLLLYFIPSYSRAWFGFFSLIGPEFYSYMQLVVGVSHLLLFSMWKQFSSESW